MKNEIVIKVSSSAGSPVGFSTGRLTTAKIIAKNGEPKNSILGYWPFFWCVWEEFPNKKIKKRILRMARIHAFFHRVPVRVVHYKHPENPVALISQRGKISSPINWPT